MENIVIVEFLRYAGEITMESSALIGFHPAKQATGLSFTLPVRKGHRRGAGGPASSHFRSFDISTAMAAACLAEMPFFYLHHPLYPIDRQCPATR